MKSLSGIVCATITPMTENGEIDCQSAARLFQYLQSSGIDGIYPNGTNGESLSLTAAERQATAELAVKNSGGTTIYIQSGSHSAPETVSHIRHAQSIGADGAGIMSPAFFKCDALAMEEYYRGLLSQVPNFPIYLYNIPSHTGNNILPETFAKLRESFPTVQGIKFSAPDLMQLQAYLAISKNVLIGCDSLILDCLIAGGAGTVSGPCAIFPKRFTRLYQQYRSGDFAAAAETQRQIYRTAHDFGSIPEIPAIKTVLKWLGIIDSDFCRAPFRRLTKEELVRLEKIYDVYTTEG